MTKDVFTCYGLYGLAISMARVVLFLLRSLSPVAVPPDDSSNFFAVRRRAVRYSRTICKI